MAAALLATTWVVVFISHRPADCYARALRAVDGNNPQRLERLQYDVLNLDASPMFEPHASLVRAKLLIAADRFTEAMEELLVADSDEQTRIRGRILAGEALYRNGQFLQAGGVWNEVLQDDPDNVDAHRWLGIAYFEIGAITQADYYLRRVAVLDPLDARPLRVLGLIWRDVEEFDKAVVAYSESLRRDPAQPEAESVRFELAESLHQLHQDQLALATLKDCRASPEVLALQAACLYSLTRIEEASALLEQAVKADPDNIAALTLRGKIAMERGDAAAAERFLRRCERLNPESNEVLYSLMAIYVRLGRRDEAKRLERRLKEVDARLNEYHNLINEATSDPANADVRHRLGLQAARLGLTHAAKWWLRASIYLDPDNDDAVEALKKLDHPYKQLQSLE